MVNVKYMNPGTVDFSINIHNDPKITKYKLTIRGYNTTDLIKYGAVFSSTISEIKNKKIDPEVWLHSANMFNMQLDFLFNEIFGGDLEKENALRFNEFDINIYPDNRVELISNDMGDYSTINVLKKRIEEDEHTDYQVSMEKIK